MQEYTPQFEYKSETTEDGSPTLRLPPTWEPMHALDGAFTETLYIYAPTVDLALKSAVPARILSVGLGLGYNEMLIGAEALKANVDSVYIDSYESVPELRQYFSSWLRDGDSPLNPTYDAIAEYYSKHYNIPTSRLRAFLLLAHEAQALRVHEAINGETQFKSSHGILFDAFSGNSSPELWDETFLNRFLNMAAAPTCFLSTYASKGSLHRALKSNGFNTEKRAGFGKKRESTLAHRSTD